MKKTFILLVFILLAYQSLFSQVKSGNKFYIGIGTSVSSYLGSDFGKTFAVRYAPSGYYNDNYYNNYYYRPNRYNNYYDRETFFPLQADLAMGYNISKAISVQIESSILWHLNGRCNRQYETGTEGGYDFIDRYDNSTLISVPIMASLKIFPFGKKHTAFFLSGGYGVQYIQEGVDRIRNYYNYGNTYNPYLYEYTLAEYKGREWVHGFKAGMGLNFKLTKSVNCDVELKATNFFPPYRDNTNPLSMYRSPNITNISLGTKVFFEL